MIEIDYQTIDSYHINRKYKSMKSARRFAQEVMGVNPDMGRGYAVSNDGVGVLRCQGCKISELFGDKKNGHQKN